MNGKRDIQAIIISILGNKVAKVGFISHQKKKTFYSILLYFLLISLVNWVTEFSIFILFSKSEGHFQLCQEFYFFFCVCVNVESSDIHLKAHFHATHIFLVREYVAHVSKTWCK